MHITTCALLGLMLLTAGLTWWLTIILVLAVGVGKELHDKLRTDIEDYFDVCDVIVDILGLILALVWYYIFN